MDTVIEVGKQSDKAKGHVAWLRETMKIRWGKGTRCIKAYRRIPFPGRGVYMIDGEYTDWFEDIPEHLQRGGFRCGGCDQFDASADEGCRCIVSNLHGWSVHLSDDQADCISCFNIWREQHPEEYEKELERVIAEIREERRQRASARGGSIEYWHEFDK